MTSIKKIIAGTQDKFRRELVKRDQTCLLSKLCYEVCEAAHIVNKEWLCKKDKEMRFSKCNGILLNSNLHKEFDRYYWSVDITEACEQNTADIKERQIECPILLYPPALTKKDLGMQLEIFKYDTIKMPVECLHFLEVRNKFIDTYIYNTNLYSENDISKCLRKDIRESLYVGDDTQINSTESKIHISSGKKASPGKKKRVRYTKDQKSIINSWMSSLDNIPVPEERERFCEVNNLDKHVFQSRFTKLWKKRTIKGHI